MKHQIEVQQEIDNLLWTATSKAVSSFQDELSKALEVAIEAEEKDTGKKYKHIDAGTVAFFLGAIAGRMANSMIEKSIDVNPQLTDEQKSKARGSLARSFYSAIPCGLSEEQRASLPVEVASWANGIYATVEEMKAKREVHVQSAD